MVRGWMPHRGGGIGLMSRIARLFCAMAFLFTLVPGAIVSAHAAMPMPGDVAGMSVSAPCQPEPMAFMPRAVS